MTKKILAALLAFALIGTCSVGACAAGRSGAYVADFGEDHHAIIVGGAVVSAPHDFDEQGICTVCGYELAQPTAAMQGGDIAGTAEGGEAAGLPQSGDTTGLAQGDAAGIAEGGNAAALPQSGDPTGLAQGDAAGIAEGGDAAGLAESGLTSPDPTTDDGANVQAPTEGTTGEEDPTDGDIPNLEVNDPMTSDRNPSTGLVLAVVPMLVAAAVIVVSRKRTN